MELSQPFCWKMISSFSYLSMHMAGEKLPVSLNKNFKHAAGWQQKLTLEGLQEQLVVGLNKLHIGLLGCSHRAGGRLVVVQPIGFTSRAQSHRVALLVRSHYNSGKNEEMKEVVPPLNVRWCKMRKKFGSSSFVKTKEQQWQKISRSGETPPAPHFTRLLKFPSFISVIRETPA